MSAMFSEVWKETIGKAMVTSQFVSQTARRVLRVPRRERAGNNKAGAKMSTNHRTRFGWLGLAMLAGAAFVAPVAQATPVTYNFTVEFPDDFLFGPLAGGPNETGSFTFDSSIITVGAVTGPALLTHLDFWHNGIHYDETTANTGSVGYLAFDASGNLTGMNFGNDCRVEWASCSAAPMTNDWAIIGGGGGFAYATLDTEYVFGGLLTYALVPYVPPGPTSVPESGTLGMMTVGLALLAVMYHRRRLS